MRRGVSDDRASKLALIQQIAQRKKDQEAGNSKRPIIIDLSDSEDDEDDYGIGTRVSNSDSEDSFDDSPTATDRSAAPPSRSLNRIRKRGDDAPRRIDDKSTAYSGTSASRSNAADDLASELQSLGLNTTTAAPVNNKPTSSSQTTSRAELPVNKRYDFTSVSSYAIPKKSEKAKKKEMSPPPLPETLKPTSSTDGCFVLGDRAEFRLSTELSTKLYPHQIEGVTWLFGLWKVGAGGILADDMGLGKTMQTSAFLSGLIRNKLAHRALILAPTTLIATWEKELRACGLGDFTQQYYGSASERERALRRVVGSNGRGVLLTTYGMVQHNAEALAKHPQHDPDDGPLWDLIIMDEGHKLKNPKMQLRARMELLPVRQRIILSGTPIQNNLMEMHALFDLVCPSLLGDAKAFKDQYERRITAGNDKHATVGERERGAATAAELRRTVAPYMLRREKKDVFGDAATSTSPGAEKRQADHEGRKLENRPSDLSGAESFKSASSTLSPEESAGSDSGFEPAHALAREASVQSISSNGTATAGAAPGTMPHKNDLVVWLRLKPNQRALYEAFLNSDSVREVLNRTRSALASLTVLKKICDHPALLSEKAQEGIISGAERAAQRAQQRSGRAGSDNDDEDELASSEEEEEEWDSEEDESGEWRARKKPTEGPKVPKISSKVQSGPSDSTGSKSLGQNLLDKAESIWNAWSGTGVETRVLDDLHSSGLEASCKTVFVLSLLRNLVAQGHRTLVFSQSRVMLNILEAAVRAEGWKFCRIDGTVGAAERAARVNTFQSTSDIPIFLLTSQVGGLGLTLTAADRVIVVDPAWNPSVDSQSVDRAYRIGQKKDVVVYRLISCGTVEDKIYRKQVFKGGLSRTGTQEGEQFRYFSAAELRDMFRLDPSEAVVSATQRQLHALHAHQRKSTAELDAHLKFLEGLEGFAGVSDHDLLYSVKAAEGLSEGAAVVKGAPAAAEYQPGTGSFAPTPSRKARGGAGAGGAGNSARDQGWSGGGDISAMFGRVLSLGGGGSSGGGKSKKGVSPNAPTYDASTAAIAAASGPSKQPQRFSPSSSVNSQSIEEIAAASKLASLKAQLQKQESLLSNPLIVAGLADGGAKIRARVVQLKAEISAMERQPSEEGEVVSSPPPPPARADACAEVATSPFQKIKSGSSKLFNGSDRSYSEALLEVPTAAPSREDVRRELKAKLYRKAMALQAAEASGDGGLAVALREEVEELNAEYETMKKNEMTPPPVVGR